MNTKSEGKKTWHTFRCTQKEADWLQEQAAKERISESEFIRRKVFREEHQGIPGEIRFQLMEHSDALHRIEAAVNSLIRSCNGKEGFSKEDISEMMKSLYQAETVGRQTYEIIAGEVYGNHKTASD